MASHVIVVGDSSDPEIGTLLESMHQAHVDYERCPNVYEAAAGMAGRPAGVLFARTQTLLMANGELLRLALDAGWQCGLLVGLETRVFPWTVLARFAARLHVVHAHDNTWQSLVAEDSVPVGARSAIEPEFLATPEEIASLLEGTEYV